MPEKHLDVGSPTRGPPAHKRKWKIRPRWNCVKEEVVTDELVYINYTYAMYNDTQSQQVSSRLHDAAKIVIPIGALMQRDAPWQSALYILIAWVLHRRTVHDTKCSTYTTVQYTVQQNNLTNSPKNDLPSARYNRRRVTDMRISKSLNKTTGIGQ